MGFPAERVSGGTVPWEGVDVTNFFEKRVSYRGTEGIEGRLVNGYWLTRRRGDAERGGIMAKALDFQVVLVEALAVEG